MKRAFQKFITTPTPCHNIIEIQVFIVVLGTSAMAVMLWRVPRKRSICGSVSRNWCRGSQRKKAGFTSRGMMRSNEWSHS